MRNDSAGVHDLMFVYFFITNSLRAKTISPCEEMQIWRGNRMGVERAEGGEASTMPGSWRGRTQISTTLWFKTGRIHSGMSPT
jgi:hypothetical protein